jgi:hypothetical protein
MWWHLHPPHYYCKQELSDPYFAPSPSMFSNPTSTFSDDSSPAISPTLPPILSAMIAGFLGMSSRMFL